MSFPTGPIPRVAYDEIIAEEWGDSVAQSLNNLRERNQRMLWIPDTEYLASTSAAPALPSALATWFRVGGSGTTITVPDWAEHAQMSIGINGIRQTASSPTYAMQVQVGTQVGRRIRLSGRSDWFSASWTDYVPVTGGDTVGVWVNASRLGGTGQFAVDNVSDIAIVFLFDTAIQWYPGL